MVKRLAVTLVVVALMAAAMVGGTLAASAQPMPGQPTYCGSWQQAWHVSAMGWPYFWWWRWCYNPSIQGGWYVDWAGWEWG